MKRDRTILLAGASRGLGLGLTGEFLARGWSVIATARNLEKSASLQEMRSDHGDRLTLETLDIARPDSIKALAAALGGRQIDVIFVVAGISLQKGKPIEVLAAETIAEEFITNATAPVALAEALLPLTPSDGLVAFMTSRLGSLAWNSSGGSDLYRASKAALNMLGVNFALRHPERPVRLFHPGWVQTDMGGSNAPLDVPTSAKGLADQLERPQEPGISYLDYQGVSLPW